MSKRTLFWSGLLGLALLGLALWLGAAYALTLVFR